MWTQGSCDGHTCVTCSDEAVVVRVVRLLPDGMALVDTEQGQEEVSVALIDPDLLTPGADLVVHAREAIGVLR